MFARTRKREEKSIFAQSRIQGRGPRAFVASLRRRLESSPSHQPTLLTPTISGPVHLDFDGVQNYTQAQWEEQQQNVTLHCPDDFSKRTTQRYSRRDSILLINPSGRRASIISQDENGDLLMHGEMPLTRNLSRNHGTIVYKQGNPGFNSTARRMYRSSHRTSMASMVSRSNRQWRGSCSSVYSILSTDLPSNRRNSRQLSRMSTRRPFDSFALEEQDVAEAFAQYDRNQEVSAWRTSNRYSNRSSTGSWGHRSAIFIPLHEQPKFSENADIIIEKPGPVAEETAPSPTSLLPNALPLAIEEAIISSVKEQGSISANVTLPHTEIVRPHSPAFSKIPVSKIPTSSRLSARLSSSSSSSSVPSTQDQDIRDRKLRDSAQDLAARIAEAKRFASTGLLTPRNSVENLTLLNIKTTTSAPAAGAKGTLTDLTTMVAPLSPPTSPVLAAQVIPIDTTILSQDRQDSDDKWEDVVDSSSQAESASVLSNWITKRLPAWNGAQTTVTEAREQDGTASTTRRASVKGFQGGRRPSLVVVAETHFQEPTVHVMHKLSVEHSPKGRLSTLAARGPHFSEALPVSAVTLRSGSGVRVLRVVRHNTQTAKDLSRANSKSSSRSGTISEKRRSRQAVLASPFMVDSGVDLSMDSTDHNNSGKSTAGHITLSRSHTLRRPTVNTMTTRQIFGSSPSADGSIERRTSQDSIDSGYNSPDLQESPSRARAPVASKVTYHKTSSDFSNLPAPRTNETLRRKGSRKLKRLFTSGKDSAPPSPSASGKGIVYTTPVRPAQPLPSPPTSAPPVPYSYHVPSHTIRKYNSASSRPTLDPGSRSSWIVGKRNALSQDGLWEDFKWGPELFSDTQFRS
ncbi:hypothetical protein DFS34DRAFT_626393 [Phlyctochytrium arcticum]|nr:hypothetical protein DFS34DRAFT_626393 [Phlyctochytrium arcticum]